ncbi:MAG: 50S ribosomal protein L15 [Candidatus Levybacteria bacterium RIFCSPLOWO2_01_FULL_39_24]|nr:MAG: 50S ribosomal protein L15 [Candidatus Levybacteria bacterium RIFCSPHIGHO2_01_FULL_40_16]OGH45950.1 MAG: 50S ribosomal protein L15 [Candidatus Levybacteria bacterium RIFCSPLOWO2_01_FULL_39_24]
MKLSSLTKITKTGQKRLGQGHGSGRGKTGGRGTKGQNAKGSRSLSFEGGALTLIKRLPFLRGKGKNKSFQSQPVTVNVESLNELKKGTIVDVKSLIEQKIVNPNAKKYGVKILGDGKLAVSLTVKLKVSKGALKKIEKAGGKAEI